MICPNFSHDLMLVGSKSFVMFKMNESEFLLDGVTISQYRTNIVCVCVCVVAVCVT